MVLDYYCICYMRLVKHCTHLNFTLNMGTGLSMFLDMHVMVLVHTDGGQSDASTTVMSMMLVLLGCTLLSYII